MHHETLLKRTEATREEGRSEVVTPQLTSRTDGWPQEEMSLWAIAASVIRQRRVALGIGLPIAGIGVALVFWMARTPTYTAFASFIPQKSGSGAGGTGLAGLAAQYGLAIGSGGDAESPEFYAELLGSRRLLLSAANGSYTPSLAPQVDPPVSLIDLYGKEEKSAVRAREATLKRLRGDMSVKVSRTTGVVSVAVKAEDPAVARQIVQAMIDEVQAYNLSMRQSRAAAERRFVEDRLARMRDELAQTERNLQEFLRNNRQFDNSPELRFAYDRRQRDVNLRQQVVTSLTESFEQARVEEVRNTPVISLIETPEEPGLPNPRGRVRKSLLVLLAAGFLGVGSALAAGMLQSGQGGMSVAYRERRSGEEEPDDPDARSD